MLHQFESTLTGHCPDECEQQYFEPIINSDSMIDSKTANRFGAFRTQDIAVIEMRYESHKSFLNTYFAIMSYSKCRNWRGILKLLSNLKGFDLNYRTHAIITRGLYNFYPPF